jgi:prepilin-type N-terminal cleavage/methylation domain-containing protein
MSFRIPSKPKRESKKAFTLVEMLVSAAVLGILVLMLAQMVGLSSQAITFNEKRLDAVGQARLVFDRIGMDLAARPRRADLGMAFTKNGSSGSSPGTNDSFAFYSEMTGYTGTRHISLIGYQIQQSSGLPYQLERSATGLDWAATGNPLNFLPQALPTPASTDYDILAPDIFRLEFCYLLNTGLFSDSASSNYSNVSAVVVAIAALDSRSRTILTNAQITQLSGDLPDTIESHDPLTDWNTTMAPANFASGIPLQAVQNIRLYQHIFYVP